MVSIYTGGLLSVTLLGWAVGGIAAGVLADYIGRKRILMLSILWYAVFAGLTALSRDYWSLLIFSFFTGIGLGAEWGPGTAIVAELWSPSTRGRAAGALHAAYGVGIFLASGMWLLLNPLGPSSWRYMFVIGIVPAFLLLYIRRSVDDLAYGSMPIDVGERRRSAWEWVLSPGRTENWRSSLSSAFYRTGSCDAGLAFYC
jgi:MFS family permease